MIADAELHRIRTGEATPSEARSAIRALIALKGDQAAGAVYSALRGWTWKALQQRRFDDELEEWYKVIRASATALKRQKAATYPYVEGLAHLIEDSIRYGASHTREQMLRRSHVGELLEIVQLANGRIERERLEERAGLQRSRLSQLLGELVVAGALEREAEGRKATFVLTDTGRQLLDQWRSAKRSREQMQRTSSAPALPTVMKVLFADVSQAHYTILRKGYSGAVLTQARSNAADNYDAGLESTIDKQSSDFLRLATSLERETEALKVQKLGLMFEGREREYA